MILGARTLMLAVAAPVMLTACGSSSDEVIHLDLAQGCLAFEAAAPPAMDDDVLEDLAETTGRWPFYRAAYSNFYWSVSDPIHLIELGRTDDFDPSSTDVVVAMQTYVDLLDTFSDDHFHYLLGDPTDLDGWQDAHEHLDAASNAVDDACAAIGASTDVAHKLGTINFIERDPT